MVTDLELLSLIHVSPNESGVRLGYEGRVGTSTVHPVLGRSDGARELTVAAPAIRGR